MVKVKESGNEEVCRARLMDKVDYLGSELILIKYLIGILCLFEFLTSYCNVLDLCNTLCG
jgi:hypothetical protein